MNSRINWKIINVYFKSKELGFGLLFLVYFYKNNIIFYILMVWNSKIIELYF